MRKVNVFLVCFLLAQSKSLATSPTGFYPPCSTRLLFERSLSRAHSRRLLKLINRLHSSLNRLPLQCVPVACLSVVINISVAPRVTSPALYVISSTTGDSALPLLH